MFKLLKVLGVLAAVTSSSGYASASSITEDFVFSYSSTSPFTLSNLSYSSSSPPSGNLLLTSPTLGAFTSSTGGSLSGSGQLSQIITVNSGQSYSSNFTVSGTPGTITTSVSVSPVPLPASFPLFAMAIIGLGMIGYYKARPFGRMVAV